MTEWTIEYNLGEILKGATVFSSTKSGTELTLLSDKKIKEHFSMSRDAFALLTASKHPGTRLTISIICNNVNNEYRSDITYFSNMKYPTAITHFSEFFSWFLDNKI